MRGRFAYVPEDGKKTEVILILVVYVDDLLVSENETVHEELFGVLDGQFSPKTSGSWSGLGCSLERE